MKIGDFRIEKLHESSDGIVTIEGRGPNGIRIRARVTFDPLLEWRQRVDDETIIDKLVEREVTVWIENGKLVQAESKPRERKSSQKANYPSRSLPERGGFSQIAIRHLLKEEKSWLYQREMVLLNDFILQVGSGKPLTIGQKETIKRIRELVEYRKLPKFFRG